MMQYISYFKLRFITNLQYRSSAIAGIFTQFFFGLVFIMVYLAFYESSNKTAPMELNQLVTYMWLQQAFFSLIYFYHREKDIINMIKNGDVAYELCRPGNLYIKWFSKIYASKLANVTLRFLPIILIGLVLPEPYKLMLPDNTISLIGYIITMLLGSILISSLDTLLHVLIFYTIDADGILTSFRVVGELFAGALVPVLFLPNFLQVISKYLPFQYVNDLPFRIYVGIVDGSTIFNTIFIQIIWITIILFIGFILTKNALKKVVVQGG